MRLHKSLFFLLVVFLILSAVALYLWYQHNKINKTTPAPETVLVMEYCRSLNCLPQYIAMEKNFFQEQNLKVELKTASTLQDMDELIKKQGNSIILCGSETLVNNPSPDLIVVAGITAREDSFLLARTAIREFTKETVRGKSIIIGEPDSLQSMVLENILRGKKIWPNYDVNLMQNLPDNLKRGLFKSGTASFIVLKEPEATLMETAEEGKTMFSLGTTVGEMPAVVLACNRQLLETHPQIIQKYINGIYKAMLWMNYHSTKETVDLIKEFYPNIEPKVLISSIDRYKGLSMWSKTPVITQPSYDNLLKIMEQSGELASPKIFHDVIDNQFATEAVKNITYTPPKEKPQRKFPFNWLDKLTGK